MVSASQPWATSEELLYEPLYDWLVRTRRLWPNALVQREVFLHGKRIDLVVLTTSGRLLAFELKLNHTRSVLAQAQFNCLSADRSYAVTLAEPGPVALREAAMLGVGWLTVGRDGIRQRLPAKLQEPVPEARRRLLAQVRTRGVCWKDVR